LVTARAYASEPQGEQVPSGYNARMADVIDLEIKLAYQDKLIRELDVYVRQLGERLDEALRDIKQLKASLEPAKTNEPPPHY
jgi:uncharacterized coiled-coil protein SlyX